MMRKTPIKRRPTTLENYNRLRRERQYLLNRCVLYRQEVIEEHRNQSQLFCGKNLPKPVKPLPEETLRDMRDELEATTDITKKDFERLKVISKDCGFDYDRLVHNVNSLETLFKERGIVKPKNQRFGAAIKITHPETAIRAIGSCIGVGVGSITGIIKQLQEMGFDVGKLRHR